jgi:replicative DNA helicase Mcm
MEGRRFDFEKFGIKANIHAPTAIIASANPANSDSWINNEKVDFNELPTLAPLKDRFGLIFIFRKRDQKGNDEFADKWSEVEAKKERGELPDYTEFLVKYIQFAKTLEPVLSDDARFMLKEFYKKVNAKGFGSLEFSRY